MKFNNFISKVTKMLADKDVSNIKKHFAVQVDIIDDEKGTFYIELKDQHINVAPYEYNDNNMRIVTTQANFLDFLKIFVCNDTGGNKNHQPDYDIKDDMSIIMETLQLILTNMIVNEIPADAKTGKTSKKKSPAKTPAAKTDTENKTEKRKSAAKAAPKKTKSTKNKKG